MEGLRSRFKYRMGFYGQNAL